MKPKAERIWWRKPNQGGGWKSYRPANRHAEEELLGKLQAGKFEVRIQKRGEK